MRCLIESVRRGEIFDSKDIETDQLRLGRGADQDIRLQSRLVGLNHAVIERENDSRLSIRAIIPNRLLVNGKELAKSILIQGDEIHIGTSCLMVREAPTAFDLRLEVREAAGSQNKELEDALLARCNINSGVISFSMRRTAWIMSMAVLILFLLPPLAGFVYKPMGGWLRNLGLLSDHSWSSGPVAPAHSFFATDCNRCHEQAFVSVRNSACTNCHKDTLHHVPATFEKAIDTIEANRCATCHKEHGGDSKTSSLISHNQAQCTRCHDNIKAMASNSRLSNVSDFGENHPEFQVTVDNPADKSSEPIRISLDRKHRMPKHVNFEFSHFIHLDKDGIKSPGRGKVRLVCADCHKPEPGGRNMAKINFENQCHECHRLNFEADDPKQELPHGDDQTIPTFLENYYANRALKGGYQHLSSPKIVRDRRRPGVALSPGEQLEIKDWVTKYARDVNTEVMRFRVCSKCHTVIKSPEDKRYQPWKIETLSFDKHKFAKAFFDHAKHKTQNCTDCHDAEKSEHSDDLLLKGIASCRECHGGANASNKVVSTCIDCHGFHTSRNLTMAGKKIGVSSKPVPLPGDIPP